MECSRVMYIDELRNYVSKLFENATEKSVIEQAAVVSSKIDELASQQKKQEEEYNKLLKDYKEVVIHSSFKPLNSSDEGAKLPNAKSSNLNDIFDDALNKFMQENK